MESWIVMSSCKVRSSEIIGWGMHDKYMNVLCNIKNGMSLMIRMLCEIIVQLVFTCYV